MLKKIDIAKCVERSQDIPLIAECGTLPAVKALLGVIEKRRDEIRKEVEQNPKHSPEDLTEDVTYLLGRVEQLNEVLGLPGRSREILDNLK